MSDSVQQPPAAASEGSDVPAASETTQNASNAPTEAGKEVKTSPAKEEVKKELTNPAPSSTPSKTEPAPTQKARAALQGMWGSFSSLAKSVFQAVEAEADSIKSEQQALKKEAALEKEPAPANLPPWLDLGTGVTDEQRSTVTRMVLQLTSSSANFLTIPIATQKEARQVFVDKHKADGEDLTAAEKKHVANTEEVPEKDGFAFELSAALASAEAALIADPKLAKMRNALVPRRISERNFWRNWLWRVYVIKTTNGVVWPTAGIVTLKATGAQTSSAFSAPPETDGSTIEDEITMALDEFEDDKTTQTTVSVDHDDSWTKEVEEALAEKP